ncbi:TatD family hydrolase [Maribacter algicola]|uniref:TatD family hydrolase n=1 Tax=Meishania litoralis TaxID=3434685 RepID=A0ACC7LKG4_9FLAO
MIITDTHTHLYSEAFDKDREEVIERAFKNGIKRFFIPAIDSTYTQRMLDLKKAYPENMFLMAGLHPTHVKDDFLKELGHVEQLLSEYEFCAIGEIGIDLYWDKTFLKEQQEAFENQIRLAKKHKLPIVIHCREAFDEIFEILEGERAEDLFGVFHCFTGTFEQAKKAISYNMKLGIGGVVTFKNGKLDTFLDQIDLNHIVLETDSPYLAPAPLRGKRNESAYLVHVLERLSDIYGVSTETIIETTTKNSINVFGI